MHVCMNVCLYCIYLLYVTMYIVFSACKVVIKYIIFLPTSVFLNPMGVIDSWAAQEAEYAAEVADAISKCSQAILTVAEKRDTLRPLTPIHVLYSTPMHTYIDTYNTYNTIH